MAASWSARPSPTIAGTATTSGPGRSTRRSDSRRRASGWPSKRPPVEVEEVERQVGDVLPGPPVEPRVERSAVRAPGAVHHDQLAVEHRGARLDPQREPAQLGQPVGQIAGPRRPRGARWALRRRCGSAPGRPGRRRVRGRRGHVGRPTTARTRARRSRTAPGGDAGSIGRRRAGRCGSPALEVERELVGHRRTDGDAVPIEAMVAGTLGDGPGPAAAPTSRPMRRADRATARRPDAPSCAPRRPLPPASGSRSPPEPGRQDDRLHRQDRGADVRRLPPCHCGRCRPTAPGRPAS